MHNNAIHPNYGSHVRVSDYSKFFTRKHPIFVISQNDEIGYLFLQIIHRE